MLFLHWFLDVYGTCFKVNITRFYFSLMIINIFLDVRFFLSVFDWQKKVRVFVAIFKMMEKVVMQQIIQALFFWKARFADFLICNYSWGGCLCHSEIPRFSLLSFFLRIKVLLLCPLNFNSAFLVGFQWNLGVRASQDVLLKFFNLFLNQPQLVPQYLFFC